MIDDTNTTEEAVEENTEELATKTEAPASLSIQDLANLKQIIDVVSSRGAFKADEMTVVGNTYNRLVAFLRSVAPAAPAKATEEAEEETSEA